MPIFEKVQQDAIGNINLAFAYSAEESTAKSISLQLAKANWLLKKHTTWL